MNFSRIWAFAREVAWTSVLSLVLMLAGILTGLFATDYLGLTIALVGGSVSLAILSLRA